jgi:hypothetical protein
VTSPTHRAPEPVHTMWADKPMPDAERRALGAATAAVWLFALAVNVNNVERHLHSGGASEIETTWLRWAPDVLLLVGAWKLRYRPRAAIAWSMLGLGVAWLVWAGLSMSAPTATGRIVSLLPILVALLMTLALEFKPATEPTVLLAEDVAEDVPPVTEDHQPVNEPVEAAPPVAPPVLRKAVPKVDAKRPAPSREQARTILGDLDSLDDKSDAELAREYGGSDTYWRLRKKDYRAALANLGAEAGTL